MARTRPRGEPKRKKSDTSKSKRPRLTSESWGVRAAGASASSFSTLEWMLPGGGMADQRRVRPMGVSALQHSCILRAGYPTLCHWNGTQNQRPLLTPSAQTGDSHIGYPGPGNIWLEQNSANIFQTGPGGESKRIRGPPASTASTYSAMSESHTHTKKIMLKPSV